MAISACGDGNLRVRRLKSPQAAFEIPFSEIQIFPFFPEMYSMNFSVS